MEIPEQLLSSLDHLEGFDRAAFLQAHESRNRITSIRFNPFKKNLPTDLDFTLGESVPWAENAHYLESRPSFTFDPLFHAGAYYVQEAGSMFLEFALKHCLDFSGPLRALDLCGAPGGKSTLVNSLLSAESLLVSNEPVRSRATILAQNLGKWGTANTVVTNNEPEKFSVLKDFFDLVVVDAPCSGSGLFRKQPGAIEEWSIENVNHCARRQLTILEDVLPCLKPGGILAYSTCSYSVQENEAIVDKLTGEYGMTYLHLPVPGNWGLVDTGKGYRFYPHLTKSEGFFIAILVKSNREFIEYRSGKKHVLTVSKAEKAILDRFVNSKSPLLFKKNGQFHLVNEAVLDFLTLFERQFYFKKAGCVLGEIKGSDMVPNQDLAWSVDISGNPETSELDLETALKFLQKEPFEARTGGRGLQLITYKKLGLGWAKILPNRINNYLPAELRILSRKH